MKNALAKRLQLAQSLLAAHSEAHAASAQERATRLRRMASQARDLAASLQGDLRRFAELSVQLGDSRLTECVLDLPLSLASIRDIEGALAVARSFEFLAPDKLRGDRAVILAQAGRREEAVALVAQNLEHAEDTALAEAKAGDAYRALGESDAAEAYYRRSLAEAKTAFERSEAVLRIVSLLSDAGREQDAARFLAEERKRPAEP
jgi:tetratricopeptide (TPR) repeat protein